MKDALFYTHFPSLKHFDKKSTTLNINKLKKVIEFMNSKRILMSCVKFNKGAFKKTKRDIIEEIKKISRKKEIVMPNYAENILGIIYYNMIISRIGNKYKKQHYTVETCIESQLNIQQVLSTIIKLAFNYNFHV